MRGEVGKDRHPREDDVYLPELTDQIEGSTVERSDRFVTAPLNLNLCQLMLRLEELRLRLHESHLAGCGLPLRLHDAGLSPENQELPDEHRQREDSDDDARPDTRSFVHDAPFPSRRRDPRMRRDRAPPRSCLLASQGNRLGLRLKILQGDASLNGLRRLEGWSRVGDYRLTVRITDLGDVRDANEMVSSLTLTINAPHT